VTTRFPWRFVGWLILFALLLELVLRTRPL